MTERNYHEVSRGRFAYTTKRCASCRGWVRMSDPDLCETCDLHQHDEDTFDRYVADVAIGRIAGEQVWPR